MPRLAVCSWSLKPSSPSNLAAQIRECGLEAVQLALDPLRTGEWDASETERVLRDNGIDILSGMMAAKGEDYSTLQTIEETGGVRPDATWADNLAAARANAQLAERLRLDLVTFHAGFLPRQQADPERARMIDRLGQIVAVYEARGVRIAFETGQEAADNLLSVLYELPETVGVNFDPANMLLYGMGDPIEALQKLAPRVAQIHVKDAKPADAPGTWGSEEPAGKGAVPWIEFFATYREAGLTCNLVIEREAGEYRIPDVRAAATLVRAATTVRG